MTLSVLLAALLLEHYRPLPRLWLERMMLPLQFLAHQLNAGEHHHGRLAWFAAMLPALLATSAVHFGLLALSGWLAWLWNIAVLYASLQLRCQNRVTRSILAALLRGQPDVARQEALRWCDGNLNEREGDTLRIAIENRLADALRRLFGVIFWFALLAPLGPVGAVFYRLSHNIAERWDPDTHGAFAHFAQSAVWRIDWLPAQALALSFAVAGNFEDAMYCWRSQAAHCTDSNLGEVLASGTGALGIRLPATGTLAEFGLGENATLHDLAGVNSLIWRTLAIWALILLLMALARIPAG